MPSSTTSRGNPKKVGFFGGTFDPIHFGHIALALTMQERRGLDEILFVPAVVSPLKEGQPPVAKAEERVEMVRLAIEGIPKFTLYNEELKRPPPSYTIDTVRAMKMKGDEIFLLVGEDALGTLAEWRSIEELLTLAPPLVGSRPRLPSDLFQKLPSNIKKLIEPNRIDAPLMEISSTVIRERLKLKLYCGHLLPAKVLDFIHEKNLYLR